MSATARRIVNPSEEELDAITEVLSEAFNHQLFSFALDEEAYCKEIVRAYLAAAAVNGIIVVGELPDFGVVGVSAWFGPGQRFLLTPEERNAGWNQLMNKLSAKNRDWFTNYFVEFGEASERLYGPGVKLGGYHLQLLGTAPNHQRKGVARTVLKLVEMEAADAGLPTLVETLPESNVPIYTSLGYTVVGTAEFKMHSETDLFKLTYLTKHPARS